MGCVKVNSGYNGCNDRIEILKNETVPRDLSEFERLKGSDIKDSDFLYVNGEENKKIRLSDVLSTDRTQSDWNVEDETNSAFIKNKPAIPSTKLDEDMISLYNVGGIKAGDLFEKGTDLLDIIKKMLSLQVGGVFRYFITDTKPELLTKDVIDAQQFDNIKSSYITEGFNWNISANNQYFVVAIPTATNFNVNRIRQGGWDISYSNKDVDGYKIYYQSLPITGNFSLTVFFKEGN